MNKTSVSKALVVAGVCISAAIVIGEAVSSYAYIKTIASLVEPKQITVTGTAEREVKSDLTIWNGAISRKWKGINDLKLEMFALALENAKAMAQVLAEKNGSGIRYLSEIQTGVFRITAADSSDSDEETTDNTISINKKAIATVTAVFEVK